MKEPNNKVKLVCELGMSTKERGPFLKEKRVKIMNNFILKLSVPN
jgi:hypothetical protein